MKGGITSRLVGMAAVVILATGCGREAAPPEADLSAMDPTLARLIEESRRQVRSAPRSADAWGKLGQAFDAADYDGQARECYRRAAELDTREPRWPYLLGLRQLRDMPEKAVPNLERAADLSHGPLDAPRLKLIRVLVERGRFDEATGQFRLLFDVHGDHPAGRLEMARLHLARGELEAAAEQLEVCLTNTYTARPALLLLANIAQAEGEPEMAAVFAQRAAQLPRPSSWPDPFLDEIQSIRHDRVKLQDQVRGLESQGRWSEAEAVLNRLFAAYPEDPEGLLLLGRMRMQQRRCPEAEAALGRYLALNSGSLNGQAQLALALLCQEKWGEAAAVLEQVVRIKPDFAQGFANLGFARSRLGDSSGAIAAYRSALRCTPGDVRVHVALAEELSRVGQGEEAARHVERARQLDPNHPRLKNRAPE